MQAWAQNLGHESLTTTFGSYGKVGPHEQGELVRNTGGVKSSSDETLAEIRAIVEDIQRQKSATG